MRRRLRYGFSPLGRPVQPEQARRKSPAESVSCPSRLLADQRRSVSPLAGWSATPRHASSVGLARRRARRARPRNTCARRRVCPLDDRPRRRQDRIPGAGRAAGHPRAPTALGLVAHLLCPPLENARCSRVNRPLSLEPSVSPPVPCLDCGLSPVAGGQNSRRCRVARMTGPWPSEIRRTNPPPPPALAVRRSVPAPVRDTRRSTRALDVAGETTFQPAASLAGPMLSMRIPCSSCSSTACLRGGCRPLPWGGGSWPSRWEADDGRGSPAAGHALPGSRLVILNVRTFTPKTRSHASAGISISVPSSGIGAASLTRISPCPSELTVRAGSHRGQHGAADSRR